MLATIAALLAVPGTAFSADKLLTECGQNTVACHAYIAGVADSLADRESRSKRSRFCPRAGRSTNEMTGVVVHELESNREYSGWYAAYFVEKALVRAFPCVSK